MPNTSTTKIAAGVGHAADTGQLMATSRVMMALDRAAKIDEDKTKQCKYKDAYSPIPPRTRRREEKTAKAGTVITVLEWKELTAECEALNNFSPKPASGLSPQLRISIGHAGNGEEEETLKDSEAIIVSVRQHFRHDPLAYALVEYDPTNDLISAYAVSTLEGKTFMWCHAWNAVNACMSPHETGRPIDSTEMLDIERCRQHLRAISSDGIKKILHLKKRAVLAKAGRSQAAEMAKWIKTSKGSPPRHITQDHLSRTIPQDKLPSLEVHAIKAYSADETKFDLAGEVNLGPSVSRTQRMSAGETSIFKMFTPAESVKEEIECRDDLGPDSLARIREADDQNEHNAPNGVQPEETLQHILCNTTPKYSAVETGRVEETIPLPPHIGALDDDDDMSALSSVHSGSENDIAAGTRIPLAIDGDDDNSALSSVHSGAEQKIAADKGHAVFLGLQGLKSDRKHLEEGIRPASRGMHSRIRGNADLSSSAMTSHDSNNSNTSSRPNTREGLVVRRPISRSPKACKTRTALLTHRDLISRTPADDVVVKANSDTFEKLAQGLAADAQRTPCEKHGVGLVNILGTESKTCAMSPGFKIFSNPFVNSKHLHENDIVKWNARHSDFRERPQIQREEPGENKNGQAGILGSRSAFHGRKGGACDDLKIGEGSKSLILSEKGGGEKGRQVGLVEVNEEISEVLGMDPTMHHFEERSAVMPAELNSQRVYFPTQQWQNLQQQIHQKHSQLPQQKICGLHSLSVHPSGAVTERLEKKKRDEDSQQNINWLREPVPHHYHFKDRCMQNYGIRGSNLADKIPKALMTAKRSQSKPMGLQAFAHDHPRVNKHVPMIEVSGFATGVAGVIQGSLVSTDMPVDSMNVAADNAAQALTKQERVGILSKKKREQTADEKDYTKRQPAKHTVDSAQHVKGKAEDAQAIKDLKDHILALNELKALNNNFNVFDFLQPKPPSADNQAINMKFLGFAPGNFKTFRHTQRSRQTSRQTSRLGSPASSQTSRLGSPAKSARLSTALSADQSATMSTSTLSLHTVWPDFSPPSSTSSRETTPTPRLKQRLKTTKANLVKLEKPHDDASAEPLQPLRDTVYRNQAVVSQHVMHCSLRELNESHHSTRRFMSPRSHADAQNVDGSSSPLASRDEPLPFVQPLCPLPELNESHHSARRPMSPGSHVNSIMSPRPPPNRAVRSKQNQRSKTPSDVPVSPWEVQLWKVS